MRYRDGYFKLETNDLERTILSERLKYGRPLDLQFIILYYSVMQIRRNTLCRQISLSNANKLSRETSFR